MYAHTYVFDRFDEPDFRSTWQELRVIRNLIFLPTVQYGSHPCCAEHCIQVGENNTG